MLLTRRKDLGILFQAWQLLTRLFDDFKRRLNLLVGNDERRREADDILMGWLGLNHPH